MTVIGVKEKFKNVDWKKKFSFFFNWRSNFYFALFIFFLATIFFGWILLENSFTHLLNWDYAHQFIPLYYHNYDIWKSFFSTGQFILYDYDIFLGTDNIGSNSFYSLFDPFCFITILFPRDWVPYVIAIGSSAKLMIGGIGMMLYLENMGISKVNSRIGALCYAFSGWVVFMFGFPSFISAAAYIPFILLGIEKVIKKKKCLTLIISLFLLGITNFFFLVCACIWGVIYSLWRYFTTIKARKDGVKGNIEIIIKGVLCFGLGLGLCAFTLLPSLRNSSLSGRGNSIGSAYLNYIKESLKSHDFKTFFFLVFEEVGDNPGRELMSLSSFFFPTESFLYLPTVMPESGAYDAWTSSIFVYSPCVIGVFLALLNSIRLKKYHHILGLLGCLYLLLTNFSYFFFYAFSGNGYGRWFIVLIPCIIYYAMWGLDQRKEEPKCFPILAGLAALVCTVIVFFSFYWLLEGKVISNPNGQTYFKSKYEFNEAKYKITLQYYLFSQIGFIVGYTLIYFFLHKKAWVRYIAFLLLTAEVVVVGVHTSDYMGMYSFRNSFAGGYDNFHTALNINAKITSSDHSHYKVYSDLNGNLKTFGSATGVNNTATFHSLMNFQTENFAFGNHLKQHHSSRTTYNNTKIFNASWSAYYGHKRFFVDQAIGTNYFVIKNSFYSYRKNRHFEDVWTQQNVPFYAEEVPEFSTDRDMYRVYKIKDEYNFGIGHAVSSDMLYRMGSPKEGQSPNLNSFITTENYSNFTYKTPLWQMERYQLVENFGAIFDDGAVVDEAFNIKTDVPIASNYVNLKSNWGFEGTYYDNSAYQVEEYLTDKNSVGAYDYLYPGSYNSSPTRSNDVNYFFEEGRYKSRRVIPAGSTYSTKLGLSHYVYTPKGGGNFTNSGSTYIEMNVPDSMTRMPVVILFGENNEVLSIEKMSLENAKSVGDVYYYGVGGTFGLYANANVAKIGLVFEGTGGTFTTAKIHDYSFFVHEGSNIKKYLTNWKNESVQNVKYSTNSIAFTTNYTEPRVVVTRLGYDAGWSISATNKEGKSVKANVYRLDGGLVGFTVPEGDLKVNLTYKTPYLKEGKLLFIVSAIGTVALVGYPFAIRIIKKRMKKKEDQVNP